MYNYVMSKVMFHILESCWRAGSMMVGIHCIPTHFSIASYMPHTMKILVNKTVVLGEG